MPRYYEEGELEKQNACDGLRADLKECLRQSDCVMKVGTSFRGNTGLPN